MKPESNISCEAKTGQIIYKQTAMSHLLPKGLTLESKTTVERQREMDRGRVVAINVKREQLLHCREVVHCETLYNSNVRVKISPAA